MCFFIFLDFDGVLHPDGVATFANLPLFEAVLLKMPDVKIVITSSWRDDHTLEQLREFFSISFREKIIGVTPTLDGGYDMGGRQKEILSYLSNNPLFETQIQWIALDDNPLFFEPSCETLILTQSDVGFSEKEADLVLKWYRNDSQCISDTTCPSK